MYIIYVNTGEGEAGLKMEIMGSFFNFWAMLAEDFSKFVEI